MFGFKGLLKAASIMVPRAITPIQPISPPMHLNWSFKQISTCISRCLPVPGSGLTIINLRQMLEKCRQQGSSQPLSLLNGQICTDLINILSRRSCIDIIGRATMSTNITSRLCSIENIGHKLAGYGFNWQKDIRKFVALN